MKKAIIGVDIGGTKIASGLITLKGKLEDSALIPTLANKGKDVSLPQVYKSIELILNRMGLEKKEIKGIGICAPGPLDPVKGVVHNPPNLKGWDNVPLAALVRKKFGINTRVENDANAAGVAEMVWGAAKGYKDIFYVTVSTGIGTGIIIDGKVYHGKNGMAGEGGHVTINYSDKTAVCACGNVGCIEALASGPATAKRFIRAVAADESKKNTKVLTLAGGDPKKITMFMIGTAAQAGDRQAVAAVKEQGRLIGTWLGGMINMLDPEIIVIGGGVSLVGEILFNEIRETAREKTINVFASKTPIVPAGLKKDVGVFGAASVLMST